MMHIALSMITKNSYEKVGNYFSKVWESSLQVPYDVIILIDDSDTDKTREYVKKFAQEHGKEVIIERSRLYGWHKPTRATARQTAIDIFFQNTTAEWLFFLDDDVILRDGWWNEAGEYVKEERVGLIWGVEITELWQDRLAYIRARGIDPINYSIQRFMIRGGLHDTMLRREALNGIVLPPWLHVYEDAWVKLFVECRGFLWKIVKTGAIHLRREGKIGYSDHDIKLGVHVDAMLRLESVSLFSFMKTLFGLPLYLYYAKKAGANGWEMWLSRVRYRYQVLRLRRKCKLDPCEVVSNYLQMRHRIKKCLSDLINR
jgi:glycosyltransferase involved in cell wall biosynthesis